MVEIRRCKWWNRGFCHEKERCIYSHPPGDCEDHLGGRCNTRGCKLRHRKKCKYWAQEHGCYRGNKCEYLHGEETRTNYIEHKKHKEVLTQSIIKSKEIQTQTDDNSTENDCINIQYSNESEIIFEKKRVICILARSDCSQEEWQEAEECAEQTNLTLEEFLVDFGKVLEAYHKVNESKKMK